MVAVFNRDFVSWYLVTLKLKETLDANRPKSQPTTPTTPTNSKSPLLLVTSPTTIQAPQPPPPPLSASPASSTATATAQFREPSWVITVREKLEQARQHESCSPWSKVCIYRVPKTLREGDEKVYVPQVVSIGPYHHGRRRLREMERHKWRALHRVLQRTGHDFMLYYNAVKSLEEKIRSCYEGNLGFNSNQLIEMMVLDGNFVLELFRGAAREGFEELGYARNDPIFSMRSTMHSIQRDMIMLENQIPLFVLERLLALQMSHREMVPGLIARLVLRFFDPLVPTDEPMSKTDRSKMESSAPESAAAFDPLSETGAHCLDVFRRRLLHAGPKPEPRMWIKKWSNGRRVVDKRRQQLVHCVMELRDAGIKCRKRKTDRFWDIEFKDGVLWIPRLLIHDGTKSLFLNLIAFEQCHIDCSKKITSYVIFMDNLINSEEDVSYLHYRGIIEHWLGNDSEVADLFNKLCNEVVFDINDSYLSGLSERVNRYYNHRWNTWRASLKHRYFNNPWAVISLFAGFLLLVLTVAQTFFSAYSYYKPPG